MRSRRRTAPGATPSLTLVKEAVRAAAVRFIDRRYPAAELVVVGGSAAGVRRPRSDIDLLVIGPGSMFAGGHVSAAHTDLADGELIETFAATPEEYRRRVLLAAARYRPVTGHMLIEGEVVRDVGALDGLVAEVRSLLEAGPSPTDAELTQRRYDVSAALDDLLDAVGPAETAVLAAWLFQRLGEFVLLSRGRWIGSGRWLLRRLEQLDAPLALALGAALAERDVAALERLTLGALEPFGGPLQAGHVRR